MFSKFLWKKQEGVFHAISGNSYGLLRKYSHGMQQNPNSQSCHLSSPLEFCFKVKKQQDPQLGNQWMKFTVDRKCWLATAHLLYCMATAHKCQCSAASSKIQSDFEKKTGQGFWLVYIRYNLICFPLLVRHCYGSVLTWGTHRVAIRSQQVWYWWKWGH